MPDIRYHYRSDTSHISVVRDATVTWLGKLLSYRYCVGLDPILGLGQGQGHGPFELPTITHNCTFLGLSPPPLLRGAQN